MYCHLKKTAFEMLSRTQTYSQIRGVITLIGNLLSRKEPGVNFRGNTVYPCGPTLNTHWGFKPRVYVFEGSNSLRPLFSKIGKQGNKEILHRFHAVKPPTMERFIDSGVHENVPAKRRGIAFQDGEISTADADVDAVGSSVTAFLHANTAFAIKMSCKVFNGWFAIIIQAARLLVGSRTAGVLAHSRAAFPLSIVNFNTNYGARSFLRPLKGAVSNPVSL